MTDQKSPAKTGWRRFVPGWKFWVLLPVGLIAFVVIGFGIAYAVTDIPDPNSDATSQTSIVYYADGTTELGRFTAQNRTSVPLSHIPLSLQQAVLAAEDRGFYSHSGFSPTGIVRATWNNVRGGPTQGGSTITQQLAKNLYLTQQRTLHRKATELVLAVKLDNTYSKDQILEDYLNTIYFGRGAYGVQAASAQYFGKPVEQLTPAESAMLASIIRSPGGYAPEDHPDRLHERWAYVLDNMVAEGWLSPAERQAATFPAVIARKPAPKLSGTTGYLMEDVRKELLARGFSEDEILRGGLRVTSTLQQDTQTQAEKAVAAQRPTKKADGVRVGLVAVEPGTGFVRASFGGEDYSTRQFDDATQATVQAGSTFKPFALAAGLENGKKLSTRYSGASPRTFDLPGGQQYKVSNFDDASYGRITLAEATAKSVNTVYVELGLDIGPEKVIDAARRAGVPDSVQIDNRPSVVLGPAAPTALNMAGAYATFADDGMHVDPTFILSVRGANGGLRYTANPRPDRAFTPEVMSDLNKALQGVVTGGSGAEARKLGRPSAGKTGTSQDNKSAWYVGYTPQLVVAVDLFRPDAAGNPTSLKGVAGLPTVTGGSFPARIWTAFMIDAMRGLPVVPFATTEPAAPSPVPTATAQPTASASASASPSASPSASATPSGSVSPSASVSPTTSPPGTPTASASKPPPGSPPGAAPGGPPGPP